MAAQPQEAADAVCEWRELSVKDSPLDFFVTGMGEDAAGELYVIARTNLGPTGSTGKVYELVLTT